MSSITYIQYLVLQTGYALGARVIIKENEIGKPEQFWIQTSSTFL